MKFAFNMNIQVGSAKQTAHPMLSWFVIICIIAIVSLLYVMQKAEATVQNLNSKPNYTQYLQ